LFALNLKKNGTLTQNFTILTGKDDVNKVGSIVSWNNMRYFSKKRLKIKFHIKKNLKNFK
jgi:hypothetical protein